MPGLILTLIFIGIGICQAVGFLAVIYFLNKSRFYPKNRELG